MAKTTRRPPLAERLHAIQADFRLSDRQVINLLVTAVATEGGRTQDKVVKIVAAAAKTLGPTTTP